MPKCSSCGAEILWGVNPSTGKRVPLSVKSMEKRFIYGLASQTVLMTETYLSHFADCPQAAQHRRERG